MHGRLARWSTWSACDVGEATEAAEGLENELLRRWSDVRVGEWGSAHSPPLHRFTYATAHSPTPPQLYLRHSSFYSPFSFHLRHRHYTSCPSQTFRVKISNYVRLMPVAHGKISCQKSYTKLFMKSIVKISCVVHSKTVRKMVWPATCGKYCELTEKLYFKPEQKISVINQFITPSLVYRFQNSNKLKIPKNFLITLDKMIKSSVKEILHLPTDTPDSMLYSSKKFKGLGVYRAQWEAVIQQFNSCRVLEKTHNKYINTLRDLNDDKLKCLHLL